MASSSGGVVVDWSVCIKPLLATTYGCSLNKSDIPDLVKAVIRSKHDIFRHEDQYKSFYSSFSALTAYHLCENARHVGKSQLNSLSQACKILLEFFLSKLRNHNEQCCLSQKELMLLIKGLCKGGGFLQRSDEVNLIAMLKSAKLPPVPSAAIPGKEKLVTSDTRDVKRSRNDPCSVIFEHLMTPIHELEDIKTRDETLTFSTPDADAENMSVSASAHTSDVKLFISRNVLSLQQLNAGEILVNTCFNLPYLRRYISRYEDALIGKGFGLPTTHSEATTVRNSFQLLMNDISIVWHAIMLPVLEPLHEERLTKLTTIVMGCLTASITVAMANSMVSMTNSNSSKASVSKDDDLDACALVIVVRSLTVFSEFAKVIHNSSRAGGHNLRNYQMIGLWTLLSGLQHILFLPQTHSSSEKGISKSTQAKTPEHIGKPAKEVTGAQTVARQNLFKVQQGFGVLSVGLANNALQLLVSLLDDLQAEVALFPAMSTTMSLSSTSEVALNVHGQYTAWQRVHKLLSQFNLTNLLFNLAAFSYRKSCLLKRDQESLLEGETFTTSDSSSCCHDDITWSEDSSDEEEDDSEPILGHWFEETINMKTSPSSTAVSPNAAPSSDSVQSDAKLMSGGQLISGALVPEKGKPHGFNALASSIFVFMNQQLLNSDCPLVRQYACSSLSEQHMIILAGIIKDLDREGAKCETIYSCFNFDDGKMYDEVSVAITKYLHNALATGALSGPLQNLLLTQLGVCPQQQEEWPLQVYQRTLAIVTQVYLLRQHTDKHEMKSESETACVLIWQRFLHTLKVSILGHSSADGAPVTDDVEDLNVEHAQLLLFLFHSLQLMQKKALLLECATVITNVSSVVHTPMKENRLLLLSRLLLIFEYLMKNLYEAPATLIDQVQNNLFSLHVAPLTSTLESDKVDSLTNKLYIPCKDIECNYNRLCNNEDAHGHIKPRFYNLMSLDVGSQDVPKLDGFSSNFLLGTPDALPYAKFYSALVDILKVAWQCDHPLRQPDQKLSYLGHCAIQYCFKIIWRLLVSLPPSATFLESLSSCALASDAKIAPLALIWIPRTAHKSFATWLKDCLVRQGLTTQKAESLLRSLSKHCKSVNYDVELAEAFISDILTNSPKHSVGELVRQSDIPQFYQICVLDLVIAKLQVTVNEAFSKPTLEADPQAKEVSLDLLPRILQLIHLYSSYIRSNILYQMNEAADPPRSYPDSSLVAHGLTIALSSSRCSKASSLALPLTGYMPAPLRTVLDRWNGSSMSEFPAISAWRNAFANDPIPSESYICAIQSCHIAALSSQSNFNANLTLKHTLHALVRFVGDLNIWCSDECGSSFVDILFPLCMDASAEYQADFVTLTLEKIIGSLESDEYLERVFYQALVIGNMILINHTDKESGLDERIFHDILKFIESMLEKTPGKKALERFYGKDKDFCDVLLSACNEHLSPSYGTKVLKLFNKLFQLAEKSPSDSNLEKLCLSVIGFAKASGSVRQRWLEKIICGLPEVPAEDQNSLQENRILFQSLICYLINECNIGEMVSNVLLVDLTPMGTKLLKSSEDHLGFPKLMGIMATLAGAGAGVGHTQFFRSVVIWLNLSKTFLTQKNVIEKLEVNAVGGKHSVLMESICCIMSYLADVLGAVKQSGDRYTVTFKSGMASPPFEADFTLFDQDSDVADEMGQDDEDSACEDSDEDSLSNKLCTYTVTQKEFMNQHWYHCHTCKMVDGVGVCTICAKVCHKDHDVTYAKYGSFFCDCGAKEDGSCLALVKRTVAGTATDAVATVSVGSSAFSSETVLPSSLRRRSSSPVSNAERGVSLSKGSFSGPDETLKRRQSLAKQLEPFKDCLLSSVNLPNIVTSVLEILQSLRTVIEVNCRKNSPVGSNHRIQEALNVLHNVDKTFETTDSLMLPTLGSQEGAFENVRMNYSGDQGQTIRQLIGAHMIHRVAMCCLASSQGRRQHLAVSHEKGKITILQLSALLKQADSSKRKLTLTRLASAPVPFTVLSIAGNPCNEEFLAVCGLKDCHVLTFTPTGSIADHLALQPQPAVGNFIIKAVWLPGSQTELALVMPDFVKIYDLAVDVLGPQYCFLLPSGKIRDCCFAFTQDGQHHLIIMSSAGHIYTQPMCEESSAKHGPFYVTTVLEVKHADLKDSNGQVGGGGVSIYYSHTLQLLFFSYSRGKSFFCPLPSMTTELTRLQPITFKTNGAGKANAQPLCQWMEIQGHPGLVCCLTQTNNNPVVLMIKPDAVLVQEIKIVPAKAKITDMVAIRHQASSGEHRTTIILLCEDGSLRIYMADVSQTDFWLTPSQQNLAAGVGFSSAPGCGTRPSKKKKLVKLGWPTGSMAFPIDFFEHCQSMNDVEFGGNDVLQIYNRQQIKHRLNTAGMYIASTKPGGFEMEITNSDSSMVMTGLRVMVGGQDVQKAPSYIQVFARTIPLTPTRGRWYDIPFSREESLIADKNLLVIFGASSFPSGVTTVDSIKVYGKSKDVFGWPEDTDELVASSPTANVPLNGAAAASNNVGGTQVVPSGENSLASSSQPLTCLDRMVAGSLEVLDNCFSAILAHEPKHPLRSLVLDLATQFLVLPTPVSVRHQTKNLIMSLHTSKVASHSHMDQALLSSVIECLTGDLACSSNLDVESFYNLIVTARSIAIARPHNLVNFAESVQTAVTSADKSATSEQASVSTAAATVSPRLANLDADERSTFLAHLMNAFWALHDVQPSNPSLAPVSQPGLPHLEAIVQALVEIIPAFAIYGTDAVGLASKLYLQLLFCENPSVSFVCKQALVKALCPRSRKRTVCIPSPPSCATPGTGEVVENIEHVDNIKASRPFRQVSILSSQEHQDLDGVSEERADALLLLDGAKAAASLVSSGSLEAPLLTGQVGGISALLDIPPDADDEAMVELAIAMSLQEQSGQAPDLGFQAFALGAQACRSSSLERAQFSDTTASVGDSDDEGSTAATDGSTLRTPPAEPGGSAGSESGGSGADSITGEHNVSGRSSATGDNVPEGTTMGARSETSSVGVPSTSLHPDADGCEGEVETDGDALSRLQNLRHLLLDRFLQYVPMLRDIGGVRSVPFLQVVLMLASDLDGEDEKQRASLENLLAVMITELELDSEDCVLMAVRTPRREVQLIIMRLLSVLMSRPKNGSKTSSDVTAYISNLTANTLISRGAINFCLQVLKALLDYWKNYQPDDNSLSAVVGSAHVNTLMGSPKGSLLKPRPVFPPPNMSPFFLKQYVKGHANDIFEAYCQLLTEMVLRLPYQIKKISDTSSSAAVPLLVFDQQWFYYLCEYMMTQQTPFVRKQVRKLLLFVCGSKDRYRQLRDLYVLESNLKEAKAICAQGGFTFYGKKSSEKSKSKQTVSVGNTTVLATNISLPYDSLITLIEHLKACEEIATSRTTNWQRFCENDEAVLPFLMQVSYMLDEGVAPIILRLLQCALCSAAPTATGLNQAPQLPLASKQQQHPSHDGSEQQTQPKHKSKEVRTDDGASTSAVTDCTGGLDVVLAHQINLHVDQTILSHFMKAFLLESNQSALRWQAHSLIHSIFINSLPGHPETLLDLMWKLWPKLPLYVRKASQFVDLLGYFAIRVPPSDQKAQEYVDKAYSLLREQNRILAYHPNAALYTSIQGLVEFDGYYLESEPCLVCNDPEVPFTNTKLSALKMDSCFTTTTQIIKLIGSHIISKIVLRIGDLKRSKMVRTFCIHYNNRSVQAVVELKNKPAMWHRAKRCSLSAGQTELKVEFPLPIVACNLMIEYTDFYENVQASSETLQCPRCSASVPANPGVCSNCGENVFQCHKCRAINYDEKDPFLCNTCGFCKYAKFDYTLMAKPCCAVDPIENEEDRKKAIAFINTLLEKADRVYRQLVASKPVLESLLSKIKEHSFEGSAEDTAGSNATASNAVTSGTACSAVGATNVNKAIQQLAQQYCCDCKSSFEELGKIVQKVLSTRRELVEYDRHQKESQSRTSGPSTPLSHESLLRSLSNADSEESQMLSTARCYGCASAATEHCVTLLRALATNARTRLIQCSQGLIRELVDYNLHQCSVQVCSDVRQLLCLLTRDNPKGTEELNSIIMEKISLALRSHLNSSDFASSVHHEIALLSATVQRNDSCWEQRLRCVMNLFLLGVNSRSPVVLENITLPCLCILQSLISPPPPTSKKNKDKSVDSLATVHIEGTEVHVNLRKWLNGDSHHSFHQWRNRVPSKSVTSSSQSSVPKKEESRTRFLAEKYATRWRQNVCKDVLIVKFTDSAWLRRILFDPPSHAARQEACNIVESLCANPVRKKEILDLLTTFLDDLGKAGESASEFLTLYQNLISSSQWKSYLAIKGVLPHIGHLITKEINHLTYLEDTTLKTDLSEGYALRILTELLASFMEQDNIRKHFKSHLLGTVLNGYLSLRKLVIQRTKMVDETQEKLLELLEEMTTGNEAEIQAFMSVCVDTVKKYPLDDYRTPVFIFERLCSIIYPEENDMGEFFMMLEKDPQQEDFLQGRMLGNPYSSNEPGLGPLMRDVKNKICQDCELVALLEDDNGMELLVNNKIISLDLPVKEVYKKVWMPENVEGEAMRIVYRMRGLMGDATEEFIESLDARSSEEVDNEEVYKMAGWTSACGGLHVMLDRLSSLNDLSRGRLLLLVMLKLFGYCTKVRLNRQALIRPEMNCVGILLRILRLTLGLEGEGIHAQPGSPSVTEQLLQIMETVLVEASSLSPADYALFANTCGEASDISFLLDKLSSMAVRNSVPVLQRLMRVLSLLATGNPEKLDLLVEFFKPCTDFVRFDFEHTSSDDLKMECLCLLANSIERNALGNQVKDRMIEANIVRNALEYIVLHGPPIGSALLLDSDELKEFITKPSLKFILRLLTGLSHGHEQTQNLVSAICIPIFHRLEQVSSDEHVGSLAENLMEALRENPVVAKKIEDVRKLTRAEKKRLAMAMREKQLAGLGMSTNERGQVTAKSSILQQMEELAEENGLVCVICREGYRFQPTKVLGIYTYTKRCNADDFENKHRKMQGYATVTHFNVVHVDCHMSAVRLARGRDEWESAALQNANTRCNGLLPLWGPQVPESAFANCLARHNTYLQECTGHRDIGYPSTVQDLKLLLLRFANEKSFSEDSGGGGPQSNLHLVPYIMHMALYVINTTRSAAKEDEALNVASKLPPSSWFESSYDVDGPLYRTTMSLIIHSYTKWQQTRLTFLRQLLVLAHCRHVHPKGSNRLSDVEVKDYMVYKPVLIFYGMVNGLYSYLFKKVSIASESEWPVALAEFIRNSDQHMLEAGDRLLSFYQNELLPCQSFNEFCDLVGLLEEIPNSDEFLSNVLHSVRS